MAKTITATLVSQLNVLQTDSLANTNDNTLTFNPQNESPTPLNAGTSPAATKDCAFTQALSSGTYTIDLTALPGHSADEVITFDGLKGQYLKMTNPSTNANKITFTQGASTAFRLDGATSWTVTLAPGQSVLFNLANATETISSSHKNIDVTGTLVQSFKFQMVAG